MKDEVIEELKSNMDKAIEALQRELGKVRKGRA